MNATDVMVSNVITVNVDATVQEVAGTLATNRVSAVPVVDREGKLAGIVSEGDLIRRSEIGTERSRSWWLDALSSNRKLAEDFVQSHSRRVSDVMTTDVISVKPDSTLDEIASLLEKNGIKRVPVVRDGTVVGIVSRANLVQALASVIELPLEATVESDASLRRKVLARLQEAPRVRPALLNVIVHDGIVDLWGTVDSEAERKAIRVATEVTPGIRHVNDNLVVQPTFVGLP
jgi:CBS domain-containing protein